MTRTTWRRSFGLSCILLVAACAATPAPPSASGPAQTPPVTDAPSAAAPTVAPTASPSPSISTEVLPGESWVAFQASGAGGYGVYLIREDGSGMHVWPSGIAGGYEHPDWSPDGTRIMVNSIEADQTEDLWIADVDGSDPVKLVDCVAPCVWADEAAWSPDGATVAFQRLVVDGEAMVSTLEILDVATREVAVVLTMPATEVVLAPRWAPDGERLVVEVIHLSEASLEVDPDGGGIGVVDLTAAAPVVEMIVPFETFGQSPDWSPDGTEIIYAQPSAADADLLDLHGVAPDGSDERRITDLVANGESAIQPAFSPEGDRILFLLSRSGREETVMALADLDGSNLRPATAAGYQNGFHPRLRPTP